MAKVKVTQSQLEMTSGNTKVVVVPVLDQDDNGIDITGVGAEFKVSKNPGSAALFTKAIADGIVLTTPDPGVLTITIAPADTQALAGTYYFELTITDPAGRISTIAFGSINIRRDVG